MATTATQLSLENQLLDRFKFSGFDPENLSDLLTILVSLRNKYGLQPVGITAQGQPQPDKLAVRYLVEGTALSKLQNILLDTPRLSCFCAVPHGLPQPSKFEVTITLGG